MTELVERTIASLGYVGVAILVALESLFPPIPSEAVLPLAGFAAGRGEASLVGMIAAATVGSMVGSWALYAIAARVGPERAHRVVDRHGRRLGVRSHHLQRAEDWFDRRASHAVLLGRCVPLVRSLVSVPAGFRGMSLAWFSVLTAIGSAMWNSALIIAGAVLGEQWTRVGDVVSVVQWVVVGTIVVLVVGRVVHRRMRARADARVDAG